MVSVVDDEVGPDVAPLTHPHESTRTQGIGNNGVGQYAVGTALHHTVSTGISVVDVISTLQDKINRLFVKALLVVAITSVAD